MVKFGTGKDQARGERFEGVKKEGFIKKRNICLMSSVTNIIIRIDLKFTANKDDNARPHTSNQTKKCLSELNLKFFFILLIAPIWR